MRTRWAATVAVMVVVGGVLSPAGAAKQVERTVDLRFRPVLAEVPSAGIPVRG